MERRSLEIKKPVKGRGSPSLDSYTDPDQLTTRQKEFCDYVCGGIPKYDAGRLMDPLAGEQQVDRWLENEAIKGYILQKGRFDQSGENQALYTALEKEVLIDAIKKAKTGDVDAAIRRGMIERLQTKLGLKPKEERPPEEAGKKGGSTMGDWLRKQAEEEGKKK
ncbi:MAG: hypothetical protein ABID54_00335 [Pseudomonadota bacterium]